MNVITPPSYIPMLYAKKYKHKKIKRKKKR